MLNTIQCLFCKWHHLPGLKHNCKYTQPKKTLMSAKRYIMENYDDIDAWAVMSQAHHNLIIAEMKG